jgi:beta-lactamase class A
VIDNQHARQEPPAPRLRLLAAAAGTLVCLVGISAVVVLGDGSTEQSAPPAGGTPALPTGIPGSTAPGEVRSQLAALERRRDARLGLLAIDTADGAQVAYRADERFALASTVKVLLAAVVLEQLSTSDLERRLFWTEADLVPHSPVTELHVEDGMTIRRLMAAALTMSDNTATNVLFDLVGGPDVVAALLAELGDTVTSVDRIEPDLNDWRPRDKRDTSTPRALAEVVRTITVGDLLRRKDRALLNEDLADSLTGARLVRAGVPSTWQVGDKSGTASYGTRNDVAVVHPPGRAPWVVVVMTSHDEVDAHPDDALVAKAMRVVVDHWS